MDYIFYLQFLIYSLCVKLFGIFTYLTYLTALTSRHENEVMKSSYDFIIVGAGTAGSLIAHRIAKETNYTYIVLEAGVGSNIILDIPALGPLLHGSYYDWKYKTVPQKNSCCGLQFNKCTLPQGKIVGGSSKLNNMIYVRGNLSHYVEWFHGKHSLNFIEKQFEYIESQILEVDDIRYESKLAEAVLNAAYEFGYEKRNLNLKFGKGFMKSKVSQKNGKRWCTSVYLAANNLITDAQVLKVLIDNNAAYGVMVKHNGQAYNITCKKSIIISAGAINTPKILQLSGIGPSDLLKSLDIPVIKSLPVGKNLQDHVTSGLDLLLFNESLNMGASDLINVFNVWKYFSDGTGPLTTPGCEVIGFLSTTNSSEPDIQFMVLPVGIASDRGSYIRHSLGIKEEVWRNYFVHSFSDYSATILPILLHPKSRGEVYIQSSIPDAPPLIDPKYLSHSDDVDTLVKGLKVVKQFIETDALKKIGGYLNPTHFPGCENDTLFSDSYWKCYIKHLTLTSYHPVGTCAMGLPDSGNSVVDTSFRVIGIDKLHVVDGSVLPTLPAGNINAAITMMANIFFETNILDIGTISYCRIASLYEYLNQICLKRKKEFFLR